MPIRTVAALLLAVSSCHAQSLAGVIDIHCHADPDSVPRSIDAIDLARMAHERGMRAIVLKSHWEPTASMAYLVRKVVPGIEVFGGIDLNRSVGGINPEAVERMAKIKGGWGRVVWLPTFDSENGARNSNRPFVSVAHDGRLLPEVKQVIGLVAKYNLTLETGHSSAVEGLMLVHEARRQGVTRIVVTHAMGAPIHMNVEQMKEAAKEGAYLEFVYNGIAEEKLKVEDFAAAIRQVGVEHCILASDMGKANYPLHPDGLVTFFGLLRKAGISQADIDRMSKTNPAKVLGLE